MRSLDASIVTALADRTIVFRRFIRVTGKKFSDGTSSTLYLWNDLGPITADTIDGDDGTTDSLTYTGSGTLVDVSEIVLANDIAVRNVSLTLNQVDSTIDTYVRAYDLRLAPVQIHIGFFNPSTRAVIAQLVPVFVGNADSCPIVTPQPGQPGSITLNCASNTRELTRANTSKRSHEDQLLRSATDTGFKYVDVMGSIQFFWGTGKAQVPTAPEGVIDKFRRGGFGRARM